jgi:hypothetical protein
MKALNIILITLCTSTIVFAQNTNDMLANNTMLDDTIIIQINDDVKITIDFNDVEELQDFIDYELNSVLEDLNDVVDMESVDSSTTVKIKKLNNKVQITSSQNDKQTVVNINNKDYYNFDRANNSSSSIIEPVIYLDWGMNNYLTNGKFPGATGAQYTVKPWGSWNVDLGGAAKLNLLNNHFSLLMGADFSWYNFKFQDSTTLMYRDNSINDLVFTNDTSINSPVRSKLTVNYVNALIMPMVKFGDYCYDAGDRMFRIGIGAYAGYRINSYTKIVDRDDGSKNKVKDHDNFYLNDFRYGVKIVLGVGAVNVFGMYDINTLYSENKGPKLNPISFGLNITI